MASRGNEAALFGPFRPQYTGQIHVRSIACTPFQTVSPRTRVNRVGRLGMAAKEENWSIEEVDRRVEANSILSVQEVFLCNPL